MSSGVVTVRYKIVPIKNFKYLKCTLYKPKEKQNGKVEWIQKVKAGIGLAGLKTRYLKKISNGGVWGVSLGPIKGLKPVCKHDLWLF